MKKGISSRLCFMFVAAVFLCVFISPTRAQAVTSYWYSWGDGSYSLSNSGNWSSHYYYDYTPFDVPNGPDDTAEFRGPWDFHTGGLPTYPTLVLDYDVTLRNLSLDYWRRLNVGGITLRMQAGSLTANSETIGNEGVATFDHQAGINTVGWLTIGDHNDEGGEPSEGLYVLESPGELTVTNTEIVGRTGIATFDQLSGNHTVSNNLFIGQGLRTYDPPYDTSKGTFNLNGGILDVGNNMAVGGWETEGIGEFSQTNGVLTVGNNLYVGKESGSSGTYVLSAPGTLSVGGNEYLGNGTAVFTQTGGTHDVDGTFYCQSSIVDGATYNLIDGTFTVWDVEIENNCTIDQTAGTYTIESGTSLNIMEGGVYNWRGGELIVVTINNWGTFNVIGAPGEERYVDRLVLASGSILNVSEVTLYYNELVNNGGTIMGDGSVEPTPGANNPPVADPNGPYTETVGTPVSFDDSGSFDPDGTIVLYEWDFENDGVFDFSSPASSAATHTYTLAGTYTVTLRVTDDGGATDTATTTASIGVANNPPVADANGPYVADEGDTVTLDASGSSDPDEAEGDYIMFYEWDLDNDGEYDEAAGVTTQIIYEDNGSYTVGLRVTDTNGASDSDTAVVTIKNVAPSVGPITVLPEALVEVGTSITASADFTDPGTLDTHTAVWNWGDGTIESVTVTQGAGSGSVSDGHAYGSAGVYTVELQVTDNDGDLGTSVFQYVVVYDPAGGFVTGGGWIDSPEGAYTPDPSLIGKATFGFVSKYKKGATTPTGNTEFQFHAGDLNFHSSSYQWLVVTGSDYAKFKGSGTINGMGDYKFMVWAGDGEPDTFRIKIWEEDGIEIVLYDNGMVQAIGGGSIVVHKAKNK